jgi:hypothetical protein
MGRHRESVSRAGWQGDTVNRQSCQSVTRNNNNRQSDCFFTVICFGVDVDVDVDVVVSNVTVRVIVVTRWEGRRRGEEGEEGGGAKTRMEAAATTRWDDEMRLYV